jgi:predicted protein tyrosine phosphatase
LEEDNQLEIKIMSAYEIEHTAFGDTPVAIISMYSNEDEKALIAHNRTVLYLMVDDVDVKAVNAPNPFTSEHAIKVLKFVEENKNKTIVCQCAAGVSRSSGMAAAISKIYNGTDDWVFGNYRYYPNMLVYGTILKEYFRQEK